MNVPREDHEFQRRAGLRRFTGKYPNENVRKAVYEAVQRLTFDDAMVTITDVPGDGSCFFHSLAMYIHTFHGEQGVTADALRQKVVGFIKDTYVDSRSFAQWFEESVDDGSTRFKCPERDTYLRELAKSSTWADLRVVVAMSHCLRRTINVVTYSTETEQVIVTALNSDDYGSDRTQGLLVVYNGRDHYHAVHKTPTTPVKKARMGPQPQ